MKKNGYTIPELLVVIVVLGILTIVIINKASFAFTEQNDDVMTKTDEMIIIKSATTYGKTIIDSIKETEQYISGKDLIDKEYLVDTDNKYVNVKIKLSYKEGDNISVEILK